MLAPLVYERTAMKRDSVFEAIGLSGIRKAAAVFASLLVLAVALSCLPVSGVNEQAQAATLATASVKQNTVVSISSKEKKAYNRAVAACMDYANQPNPIVVDVSDLGLTAQQAYNVGSMMHSNGELFWINTYNDDSYGKASFTLPCYYDDATITTMRKQLDAEVKKALKRIGPGMTQAEKVHMLHDYLADHVSYGAKKKDAYTGLVQGKGDCFGYALSMDVLLRRSGFSTDMAFNDSMDHCWNLVQVGSSWYHVDVTFDDTMTGRKYSPYFDWRNERCHLYLLQSDEKMNNDSVDPNTYLTIHSHRGWTCHHKCTNTQYDANIVCGKGGSFADNCSAYKNIVRTFTKAGLKFSVTDVKKVSLAGVPSTKKRKATKLSVPASVTYKGVTYDVGGITSKALAKSKAKTLKVSTAKLTKSGVKNSLTNTKVKKVKLLNAAKKKKSAYKTYFKKANSGRSVQVA